MKRSINALFLALGLAVTACGSSGNGETTDVVADTPTTDVLQDTTTSDTVGTPDMAEPDSVTPDNVIPDTPAGDIPGEVCVPQCDGKQCGDDGCGNPCGVPCLVEEGNVCDHSTWTCVTACSEMPLAWGPLGMFDSLETPSNTAWIEANCADYDSDGKGDNSFAIIASILNPQFLEWYGEGSTTFALELVGVTDFVNTASFEMNGLLGAPTAPGSAEFRVDELSYDQNACEAFGHFPAATLASGVLTAGPLDKTIDTPFINPPGVIVAKHVKVQVTIAKETGGVSGTDGVLTALLPKAEALAFLAAVRADCTASPEANPEPCAMIEAAADYIDMFFDIDTDNDGTNDAAALCFRFTMAASQVIGYHVM